MEFTNKDGDEATKKGDLGLSGNGGTPIAGWFISWKIPLKWMMTGGTPISGNHHLSNKK